MKDIVVGLKPSYRVQLRNSFDEVWSAIRADQGDRRLFIIADARLIEKNPAAVRGLSPRERRDIVLLRGGESCKSMRTLERLHAGALARHLDREALVIALGGGTVGDVAGFFAATYMRGLSWCTVATTSLAMSDSAVGGKTAVNFGGVKNLVGAFHQPVAVYGAAEALWSLPRRHRRAGLAEVVKSAVIADPRLFDQLERLAPELDDPRSPAWLQLLHGACRVKARIVAADEREGGQRALLNFGHSFGHALEAVARPRPLHGEAVALGMIAASSLSVQRGLAQAEFLQRLRELLRALGLPGSWVAADFESLWHAMTYDKKSRRGKLRVVLTEGLGSASFGHDADRKDVRRALREIAGVRGNSRRQEVRR